MPDNNSSCWPLRSVIEPDANTDVVVLTGGGAEEGLLPARFRELIREHEARYREARPLEKPIVSLEVVGRWRDQTPRPGRFLGHDPSRNLWNDVGDREARRLVSRLLRRGGGDLLRRHRRRSTAPARSTESDRIPRFAMKLYHREEELRRMQEVLTTADKLSGGPAAIHITGKSGSGKTALAAAMAEKIGGTGYFISGKFDRLRLPEPYPAFRRAFRSFVQQVEERGQVEDVRSKVLETVGGEAQVLAAIIPELDVILGTQQRQIDGKDVEEDRRGSVVHFRFVFRQLVRALSSKETPLVLFLDDVQYADEESIAVIHSLLTDTSNDVGFLLLVTYRGGGNATDPLGLSPERSVTRIKLEYFGRDEIASMLEDVLKCPAAEAQALSELVWQQTKGNLFYLAEFLRFLREEQILYFDQRQNRWMWEDQDLELAIDTSTVEDLIRLRLNLLSPKVQEILRTSAFLGSSLNEDVLAILTGEPVDLYLASASECGLICRDEVRDCFVFYHEAIQETIYRTVAVDERKAFHRRLGRRLWKKTSESDSEKYIFEVVGQLILGDDVLSNPDERSAIATLCLTAGSLAARSSSYQSASRFLRHGISTIRERAWRDHYDLNLALHNAAAEVEYCNGSFENVEEIAQEAVQNARCFNDTLQAEATMIYALASRGRHGAAINRSLTILESLGEKLPRKPSYPLIGWALFQAGRKLRGKSDRAILRLPTMTNSRKLQAMKFMNIIWMSAFNSAPQLAMLLALRMVILSVEYGLNPVSAVGFACYGMLLVGGGKGGKVDEGYRMGQLSLQLLDLFQVPSWIARVTGLYFGCICGWKEPVRNVVGPLRDGHRAGLQTGDIEMAMLDAGLYCWIKIETGTLQELFSESGEYCYQMEFFGQWGTYQSLLPWRQMISNLMGLGSGDPGELSGDLIPNESAFLAEMKKTNLTAYMWSHYFCMVLRYFFGEYETADCHAGVVRELISHFSNSSDISVPVLFDGLTAIACARNRSFLGRRTMLARVRERITTLQEWSTHEPINFYGKQMLLEAELASVQKDNMALAKYESAIALSKRGGFRLQEALSNELAGGHCLKVGNKEKASRYFERAIALYQSWGGHRKVTHLRDQVGRRLSV